MIRTGLICYHMPLLTLTKSSWVKSATHHMGRGHDFTFCLYEHFHVLIKSPSSHVICLADSFLLLLRCVFRRGSGFRPLSCGSVQANPWQPRFCRSQWPSGRHPLPKPQYLWHCVSGENPSSRRWNNIQHQEPATVSLKAVNIQQLLRCHHAAYFSGNLGFCLLVVKLIMVYLFLGFKSSLWDCQRINPEQQM